jgi:hypothetical protein
MRRPRKIGAKEDGDDHDENALRLPRRHVAAAATKAAAPEATEAATAAPSRIANTPTRGCEASMAPASDHGDRPPAHWQLACNIIILMETMAHDVKRKGGRFETSQDFAR